MIHRISRATGLKSDLMVYLGAFESKDDLLGGLGLLVEDGFGLTTVSGLLSVVTTLTLGEDGVLTLLVLGDLIKRVNTRSKDEISYLEGGVLVQRLTERFSSLWYVDHADFSLEFVKLASF